MPFRPIDIEWDGMANETTSDRRDENRRRFGAFLEKHGVSAASVSGYIAYAAQFVEAHGTGGDRSESIVRFEQGIRRERNREEADRAIEAVRLFLYWYDRTLSMKDRRRTPESERRLRIEFHSILLNRVRRLLRLQHKSLTTEKTYLAWVRRFLVFAGARNPDELDAATVQRYLSHLAVERTVASSTQQQAFNALVFFFRHALGRNIESVAPAVRAHRPKRLPVVLSRSETAALFESLGGVYRTIARLIYASGLRLNECLSLRIQDLDFEDAVLTVRSGKGDKDRVTLFPVALHDEFRRHLSAVRVRFDDDRRAGEPGVSLPMALARKYPTAQYEWSWYWVFPAQRFSIDPSTGRAARHHLYPSSVQKRVRSAVLRAGIEKRASVHTLRHSFATHLVENGYDIRTVQELLGHNNVQTTMIYTHVAQKNRRGVISPLDSLPG